MKIDLVELLNSMRSEMFDGFRITENLYFDDGKYNMSIQASIFHYSVPRQTLPFSEYTHFEVKLNIPKRDIPRSWSKYQLVNDNIYPFVSKENIELLIEDLSKKYGMIY